MWPFSKKKSEKPRFKYLPITQTWYYDDGKVFIARGSLGELVNKYKDYRDNKCSAYWLTHRTLYKALKELNLELENDLRLLVRGE